MMNRKKNSTFFVVLVVIFASGFCGNAWGMEKFENKVEEWTVKGVIWFAKKTIQKKQNFANKQCMKQFCPEAEECKLQFFLPALLDSSIFHPMMPHAEPET